jgi:hypothetical protein
MTGAFGLDSSSQPKSGQGYRYFSPPRRPVANRSHLSEISKYDLSSGVLLGAMIGAKNCGAGASSL